MSIGQDPDALDSIQNLLRQWIGDAVEKLRTWKLLTNTADANSNYEMQLTRNMAEVPPSRKRVAAHAATICFNLSIRLMSWQLSKTLGNLVEALIPGYFSSVSCYTSHWPWQRFLWRGMVEEHNMQQESAFFSFAQSLHLMFESIRGLDNDRARAMYNHPDISRISCSVARLCLSLQDGDFEFSGGSVSYNKVFRSPSANLERLASRDPASVICVGDAVPRGFEMLECVKARLAFEQQMLHDWVTPDTEVTLRRSMKASSIWLELESLGPSRTTEEEVEFQELGEEARAGTRFVNEQEQKQNETSFSGWHDFADMAASIEPETIVLYTVNTTDGLGIFCIDQNGVRASRWNPGGSFPRVAILVSAYLGQLKAFKQRASLETLARISIELSNLVIKPVQDTLQQYPRITFVPSGHLARYPLAALIIGNRYLGSDKVVWQVPSLSFQCHHARNDQSMPPKRAVSVIAKPGTIRAEIMPGGEPRLPMGGIEAQIIGLLGDNRVLDAARLSRNQFCDELAECQMLHLCTHGYVDAQRPLNSYISLRERLRVLDLTAVGSRAEMVVFSTCLSGAGNPHPNDDVVGFAHAILATGVKLFAGCLWEVNEVATLLHTYFVYWLIRERGGYYGKFVDLWEFATRALLSLNITGARNHLQSILSMWDQFEESGQKPNAFVRGGRQRLLEAIENLTDKDDEPLLNFAHPYIWAPYTTTGFADWNLMMATNETLAEMEGMKVDLEVRLERECSRTELWTAFWAKKDNGAEGKEKQEVE